MPSVLQLRIQRLADYLSEPSNINLLGGLNRPDEFVDAFRDCWNAIEGDAFLAKKVAQHAEKCHRNSSERQIPSPSRERVIPSIQGVGFMLLRQAAGCYAADEAAFDSEFCHEEIAKLPKERPLKKKKASSSRSTKQLEETIEFADAYRKFVFQRAIVASERQPKHLAKLSRMKRIEVVAKKLTELANKPFVQPTLEESLLHACAQGRAFTGQFRYMIAALNELIAFDKDRSVDRAEDEVNPIRRKRGRRLGSVSSNLEFDRQVFERWAEGRGSFKRFDELARSFGMNHEEAWRAKERHRDRLRGKSGTKRP